MVSRKTLQSVALASLAAVGGGSAALGLYAVTRPEPPTPLAVVGSDAVDLGRLTPGQIVKTRFVVRNVSWSKSARIRDTFQSCACTVANVSRSELKPGDQADVDLTFTAGQTAGPTRADVLIITDVPGKELPDALTLIVMATVDPRPEGGR